MTYKVGDYDWRQLSVWDSAPKDCIEKFVRSNCGKHIFHFYLQRVKEVVSDSYWKLETVKSLEGVPEDVLNWRNDNYRLRAHGKAVQ